MAATSPSLTLQQMQPLDSSTSFVNAVSSALPPSALASLIFTFTLAPSFTSTSAMASASTPDRLRAGLKFALGHTTGAGLNESTRRR